MGIANVPISGLLCGLNKKIISIITGRKVQAQRLAHKVFNIYLMSRWMDEGMNEFTYLPLERP